MLIIRGTQVLLSFSAEKYLRVYVFVLVNNNTGGNCPSGFLLQTCGDILWLKFMYVTVTLAIISIIVSAWLNIIKVFDGNPYNNSYI